MLVINRKTGQRVMVGDTWVTVLRCSDGRVRLGFDGPAVIVREEAMRDQEKEVKNVE